MSHDCYLRMHKALQVQGVGRKDELVWIGHSAGGQIGLVQRHLWLARLMEWLRHAPLHREPQIADAHSSATPPAVLRLRHLLNVLEKNPEHQAQVAALFAAFWRDIHSAGLFSDFGFGPRMALASEIWDRLRLRVLPTTPDTRELAELFPLLFKPEDALWLAAIDEPTLQRLGTPSWRGLANDSGEDKDLWRSEMMDAVINLSRTAIVLCT